MKIKRTEVPREEWPTFCRSFSRRHRGWLVAIREVRAPGPPAIIAHQAPLDDLDLTARPTPRSSPTGGDAHEQLRVSLAATGEQEATALVIHRPHRLAALTTEDGAHAGLRIETTDGNSLELRFRTSARLETVDGII